MKAKEPQNAISIEKILSEDIYTVPIYQRNYEWDKPQISKLIDDINGAANNYYLGTLVTAKKDDVFELIDGQQRHTTLNLIKAVLEEKGKEFNLRFDARKECNLFFNNLKNNGVEVLYDNVKSKNLRNGIDIVKDIFFEKSISKDDFKNKFYNKTYIFRTELPAETNLNHYFEIMNNRGEQLENHEILKAQMMSAFKSDQQKSDAFSEIWDACSYMGDYIWRNFKREQFERLLNNNSINLENWNSINNNSEDDSDLHKSNSGNSISDIINNHKIPDRFTQEEQEKAHKYRSVIDFSTFLLYVLSIIKNRIDFNFDEKKLIDMFEEYKVEIDSEKKFSIDFSEAFIKELLRLRFYFDKYVIKQDLSTGNNEQNWGIRSFELKDQSFQTKERTYENPDDFSNESKIEMHQAMFYYASVSNNKKEWLINILKNQIEDAKELYSMIFKYFQVEIKDIIIEKQKYPEVNTKVFYYFDYMLWEFYTDFLRGDSKNNMAVPEDLGFLFEKIKNNLNLFSTFKFRQLNSKEHLLSQDKFHKLKEKLKVDEEDLNYFKNLCLISSNENSSAGNNNHFEKRELFRSNNSSLKRLMMFESFDNQNWGSIEMNNHQNDMQKLLDFYKNK